MKVENSPKVRNIQYSLDNSSSAGKKWRVRRFHELCENIWLVCMVCMRNGTWNWRVVEKILYRGYTPDSLLVNQHLLYAFTIYTSVWKIREKMTSTGTRSRCRTGGWSCLGALLEILRPPSSQTKQLWNLFETIPPWFESTLFVSTPPSFIHFSCDITQYLHYLPIQDIGNYNYRVSARHLIFFSEFTRTLHSYIRDSVR